MDIEKEGIKFKIIKKDHIATFIGSSDEASNTIIIPKYVEYKNERYKVMSINQFAFQMNYKIRKVLFPDDFEVESFGHHSFSLRYMQKSQIPASLKNIESLNEESMCIKEIEISPKNKNFSIIEDIFLVCKNSENSDTFDTLLYTIKNH